MDQITNVLYWLSSGLLIPTVVFLLFFFARSLVMIGGFYGHYLARNKINVKLNRQIDDTPVGELLGGLSAYSGKGSALVAALERIDTNRDNLVMMDKIFGDYEVQADKELGKSKLLTKIGPILGLMGTLIPMGPALAGLGEGNVAAMASNMQVGFATTVIGLIIGAVGFITLQVKQRWSADDMNILEYVIESLKQK